MFNNKIVKIVGNTIGVYLLIKILLTIVMYIWAMVEVPPLPIINPQTPGSLLTLLDTIVIYAVEIAVIGLIVKYLAPIKCPTCPPSVNEAPKAAVKKPARSTKSKKK